MLIVRRTQWMALRRSIVNKTERTQHKLFYVEIHFEADQPIIHIIAKW